MISGHRRSNTILRLVLKTLLIFLYIVDASITNSSNEPTSPYINRLCLVRRHRSHSSLYLTTISLPIFSHSLKQLKLGTRHTKDFLKYLFRDYTYITIIFWRFSIPSSLLRYHTSSFCHPLPLMISP